MSKRLYSEVVKGSSSEDETEHIPQSSPKADKRFYCLTNWLEDYQEEDEHIALQKALKLSKETAVSKEIIDLTVSPVKEKPSTDAKSNDSDATTEESPSILRCIGSDVHLKPNSSKKKAPEFEWWDDEEYCPGSPVIPCGHSFLKKSQGSPSRAIDNSHAKKKKGRSKASSSRKLYQKETPKLQVPVVIDTFSSESEDERRNTQDIKSGNRELGIHGKGVVTFNNRSNVKERGKVKKENLANLRPSNICLSEHSSGSSSEIDSSTHEQHVVHRGKYCADMWVNVPVDVVVELPDAIDGLVAFELIGSDNLFAALKDGRKWKKSCPSQWKGHTRVRYADCKGSYSCTNTDCPYMVQYGVTNTTQFERVGSKCKACGHTGQFVPCAARRYISYEKNSVKVLHTGNHTCQPSLKTSGNIDRIKKIVKENPTIKPTEVQSSILFSAFREHLDWSTVEKEARSVVNKRRIGYIKEQTKKQVEPYGHNFEAVVNFKEYCDKKDKFYVYKVNDKRGNPDQPSFVFKTSTEKLKIAIAMDRTTEGFLSEEFCFFDGKHNRCRGFITLTASVYHPLLRKQIPLAIMEAESENTENVELFWKLFNEALSKYSNGPSSFDPVGWCTDMAGAVIAGICKTFGGDSKSRIKSCEFHFKDQRNKRANRLDNDSAEQFKNLCNMLLKSTTEASYESVKKRLDSFIEAEPDREFLKSWVAWWNERRGFIFHAFAPTNAPRMNQAEVIHAGWAHKDRRNMSLLDVCQADARDNLLLEIDLQGLQTNSTTKGRGPSFIDNQLDRHLRETERARRLGREMFDGHKIDPKSSHRPPPGKKSISKKKRNSIAKKKSTSSTGQAVATSTSCEHLSPRDTTNSTSATLTSFVSSEQPTSLQTFPSCNLTANTIGPIGNNLQRSQAQHLGIMQQRVMPTQREQQQTFPTSTPMNRLPPISSAALLTMAAPVQQQTAWHSGMSPHGYEFIIMPSNVKKCYGCNQNFVGKYRTAPDNIVIKHVDKRVVGRDERTGNILYSGDYANTYYHPIPSHIQRKNPLFTGLVYVNFQLYETLEEGQRKVLNNFPFNTILR